jgi:site-specific DNA-methyltransferase (adenine-specific)
MQAHWKSKGSAVYLADAFDAFPSIEDNSVDCVWTDPPYFLSNDGFTCKAGEMVPVNKGDWDRSKGVDEDHAFNRRWLSECYRVLKPAGTIWVSGTHHVYLSVGFAMMQLGYRVLNDVVWEKPNPPPNLGTRTLTHSTEVLLWATKAPKGSKHKYTFNYDDLRSENGGKQMKTVWRFQAPRADEKRLGGHPTQKPLELVARCLRAATNEGDLVLDPFMGSGTTGVAAMRLGRRFIGFEQDKRYVATALKRFQDKSPVAGLQAVGQARL